MSLSGKAVVVTGASAGIGAAIALKLAGEGASLVLGGRDDATLAQVAADCEKAGAKVARVLGDVRDEATRREFVSRAVEAFGGIDVLVNNAGALKAGKMPWGEEDMADYDVIMDTNVRAVVSLNGLALPHLKARKGNIVNISSISGIKPLGAARQFYCMSKAALDMHTKCLAESLGPDGVRVNSVNPGTIPSSIHRRLGLSPLETAALMTERAEATPMRRVGTCAEIADAVAFLASDSVPSSASQARPTQPKLRLLEAAFITGHLLVVDGGWAVKV